jgi:hypothetical protein
MLRDLEIDTTLDTSAGLDSTAALLKAFGAYMHQSPKATFPSLKRLTLVFGDSSLVSNNVVMTTQGTEIAGATGATTLHMQLDTSDGYGNQDSLDEDDEDGDDASSDNEHVNGEAAAEIPDPSIAFCLSPEKAPFLECVSLRGTASPISTIKVVAFLRYMLRSRVGAGGVAKKLKSVIIHARCVLSSTCWKSMWQFDGHQMYQFDM